MLIGGLDGFSWHADTAAMIVAVREAASATPRIFKPGSLWILAFRLGALAPCGVADCLQATRNNSAPGAQSASPFESRTDRERPTKLAKQGASADGQPAPRSATKSRE